jgi:hypothetical protein
MTVLVMDDTIARLRDSAAMTLPIVTETVQALEPVDQDTFLAPAERAVPASWPLPRRRPADA